MPDKEVFGEGDIVEALEPKILRGRRGIVTKIDSRHSKWMADFVPVMFNDTSSAHWMKRGTIKNLWRPK